MAYWQSGTALTFTLVLVVLALGAVLRHAVPALARIGLPTSILGGVIGLALGPSAAGLLPMNVESLESLVYHGLALVFIAVGLQTPRKGSGAAGAISFSFGFPLLIALQMLIGLAAVLVMGDIHPGVGMMLALGFEQGPGQALSMGSAWESGAGMTDGAQIGLIFATIGFGWAIALGIPAVAWGRRRGLLTALPARSEAADERVSAGPSAPGALEGLATQLACIGVVYLMTYGVVWGLSTALSGMPGLSAMAWGFHYIFGAVLAIGARVALARRSGSSPLDDALLGRISGAIVDAVTCSALCAVQLAVLRANLVPIAVITTLGGVITLLTCFWLAPRVFPDAPFEHGLVLFGSTTGTLPVGLALLRIVDPDLRGPAAMSAVLGSGGALPLAAPLMMGILPWSIAAWPDGYPAQGWTIVGVLALICAGFLLAWRVVGPARYVSLSTFWPSR